jgi:DNA-binding MarR family transcriptional regulator/GNAT superfamily N-acetyltransferase
MTTSPDIRAFREFNRTYTRVIGTLNEGLLSTEYSLVEARIIYELATTREPKAKEIAEALGLDQGYLSRLLKKFESSGLIKRKASRRDGRSADIELARKGKAVFENLDALSNKQANHILGSLSPADKARFMESIHAMQKVLAKNDEKKGPYILRPHRVGDMGWVVHREVALYAEEYGFDENFELLILKIVTEFLERFDAQRERCWIAEMDGQCAGHVFLVKDAHEHETAKLRLLLVEPSARGKGLGHALVNECIRFARTCGYQKITLWTQSILLSAHHIYKQAGFRLVKEEQHHSFGKDLIGQTWELDLTIDKDRTAARQLQEGA